MSLNAISLFTGAGGMDVGFRAAGFHTIWANDIDTAACRTYEANHTAPIRCGDLRDFYGELSALGGVDLVYGGPPCQGFSVAGKMNPSDPRSALLWEFLEVVQLVKPRAFVCENVAALGRLEKWKLVRRRFLEIAHRAGYTTSYVVLPAYEYGVPQTRQRVFFIGLRDREILPPLTQLFESVKAKAPTVREVLTRLGRPGTPRNSGICRARITIAQVPVLRRSPYAGMLFNGLGRPLNPEGYAATMHASMGGNKTPFVDERQLYEGEPSWVEAYHARLMKGESSLGTDAAPAFLRRLTVSEATALQTFPEDYTLTGPMSAQFRQIGNAVPCKLAEAVGRVTRRLLGDCSARSESAGQRELWSAVPQSPPCRDPSS